MKKNLLILMGWLMSYSMYSQSQPQVFKDWSTIAGTQAFFQKSRTTIDASGNVYVAGATLNGSGNYDILVSKTNSSGAQQWIQQYNGAGNNQDLAVGLYVDASLNVYITGVVTTATNIDMITIKYNSSGTQQWLSTYNGSGSTYDCGSDVTTDAIGNVYVCGSSYNASGNTDYVTIKYNSSGTQQWATLYNHSSNMNDAPVRIVCRPTRVVVSGAVQTGTTAYSFGILKYNITTGAQTDVTISSGGSSGIDQVFDMAIDTSDNVYIAGGLPVGGQGYNTCVIKLNSSLAIQWQSTYNGASNLDDMANGIDFDASGNVYFTGYTTSSTQGKDYLTVKYNSSGTQQWAQTYNDALNGDDAANGIVLDAASNVYVTGYDSTLIDGTDYYTMKYNSSGTLIWSIREDGDAHGSDKASNIAISGTDNIAVTGSSQKSNGTYEFKTIKYVQKDIITPTDYNGEAGANSFLYYENKGQLLATDTTLLPTIKYYTNNASPSLYFKNNTYSILFARIDIDSTGGYDNDSLHRIDVSFTQVGANAKTYSMEKQPSYLNYFLAHCNPEITEVYGNARLVTTDLYTNIDAIYYSNQKGFKYYFIVKPGGNPADIKMEYTGASSFNLNGTTNALTINSSIGSITYDRPTVYQVNSSNVVVPITAWTADWQTNGATNKYKFNLGAYDNTKALIIEIDRGNASVVASTQNIKWSTYLGGPLYDQVNQVKSDVSNNLFAVGQTWATGFPQATGATVYQPTFAGSSDGFVTKFKPTGQLEWTTYIGGSREDWLTSLDFSATGDIYSVGNTRSGDLLPKTKAGAYNNGTFVGPNYTGIGWLPDGFIFQVTQAGNISPWTTYYTGNDADVFNKCKFDANGNFFVVGTTASSNIDIVATGGQYNHPWTNPTTTPHIYDGYIVRFDAAGGRTWATCLGASTPSTLSLPDDELYGLDFDASNDLYVVGRSSGTNYPNISTGSSGAGTLSTNYGQNGVRQNGVITRFSNTGGIKWSTYIGSSLLSVSQAIRISNGKTYIVGATNNNDFPLLLSGNYYAQTHQGNFDATFSVFNGLDQLTHSTYIGASGIDEAWDIQVDQTNMIYVAGKTTSNSLPLPVGGNPINTYDTTRTGLQDYFICTLREFKTGLLWSTLVGGTGDESAGNGRFVSIATDGNNYLHLAGQTNSTAWFPTDDGGGPPVHFQGTISSTTDGTITRFDMAPVQLTGVNENGSLENGIFVYPNPTSSSISVRIINLSDKQTYTVYNNLGQILLKGKIEALTTTIDLQSLSSGMYFLEIADIKTKATAKFIKNE